MKAFKNLFKQSNTLFAIDADNRFWQIKNGMSILPEDNYFPELLKDEKVFIENKYLITITLSAITIYDIEDNFQKKFNKAYKEDINIYDTTVNNGCICLYLSNGTCVLICPDTFTETIITKPGLILFTDGKSVLSIDYEDDNTIFFKAIDKEFEFNFNDSYNDPVTDKPLRISLIKAIIHGKNSYVLQSEYNYLYRINIDEKINLNGKIVIENTFLGDTVCIDEKCYHITNHYIYLLNWDEQQAEMLLDWTTVMDYIDYSGIKIVYAIKDIIIFLGTKRGTVVFYSVEENKVLHHVILNAPFAIDTQSIILNDIIYLIDLHGELHSASLPSV
jgi:hypothetical protein